MGAVPAARSQSIAAVYWRREAWIAAGVGGRSTEEVAADRYTIWCADKHPRTMSITHPASRLDAVTNAVIAREPA
jgi:hypothetical protein